MQIKLLYLVLQMIISVILILECDSMTPIKEKSTTQYKCLVL